ncbi:Telomerase activating protein Est1 [Prunus dulcis]|uniref:Telomerase activating protein Est1 n=1 Tax=Prunus dulcis TaxID=3755 RepID=A0A4Y1RTW6_PRUDU|nr:Telomerase activating protein Est1 [Prunus dulcis]
MMKFVQTLSVFHPKILMQSKLLMLLNCMIWGALVTSSEGRLIVQEYQPSECFCTLQFTLKVKVVLVVYLLCLDLLSIEGPAQPDRITKIRLQFQTFLSEATGFYHDLIVKMRAKYGLPLASGASEARTEAQLIEEKFNMNWDDLLQEKPFMGHAIMEYNDYWFHSEWGFKAGEGVVYSNAAKNVISWTTMITGYVQDGQNEKALMIFSKCWWIME